MIIEYIEAALSKAKYEIINDEEPFYGEVPGLQGVWAKEKRLRNAGITSAASLMGGLSYD